MILIFNQNGMEGVTKDWYQKQSKTKQIYAILFTKGPVSHLFEYVKMHI